MEVEKESQAVEEKVEEKCNVAEEKKEAAEKKTPKPRAKPAKAQPTPATEGTGTGGRVRRERKQVRFLLLLFHGVPPGLAGVQRAG